MTLVEHCTGVLGAVALPVVGVGVGVAQIVRGVANTPEAIRELHKGKSWDQVTFKSCSHEQKCASYEKGIQGISLSSAHVKDNC